MALTMRKIEVPESEFLERLERIEEASKDWAAAEERGDLVSPEEVRARRKARRTEQGRD